MENVMWTLSDINGDLSCEEFRLEGEARRFAQEWATASQSPIWLWSPRLSVAPEVVRPVVA